MTTPPPGSIGIDELLKEARSHLTRITPEEAYNELRQTGEPVLVDIRPAAQRAGEGSIDGALIVERNVLEWRFDPRCSARLPIANRYDLRVVVFCQEGYTSSLAARALQQLGLYRATDVVGGFRAWREAGLSEKI
ncbi:Rhodanese-like domain-containing protein [Lophiotrema nucula]|uniref:Rhodanese-like domain-containing protein n=1 Tax=Lophiotrema nucula TaxID=690887 RepID=A0A6A5ZT68_9PLEO|nr:Rhodanese-like domain-containing protein [Lophiotrema nucula]